tara:strand:- start:17810 stop:19453 length:1644 start_codon:yes stop_codon:yes gene_type:complete
MIQRPRGIGSLTPSYDYQSLSQMGDPLVMARARREYAPQRYSQFDYLLDPVASRDVAPAPAPMPTQPMPTQPMPPIESKPMPMPTDPVATQPPPVATQPPPATPPMQTDPMPQPDPTPVTPEAFDPTVPVSDPMQPERPDPIIDTKKTPTTLAELEAMLGIKFVRRTSTSPIGLTDQRTSDQRYLREMAKQYGIALPPDAPIDMTGFEDPPLDSTPPVGTTPPTNMPAPGTVINLPFGGSFTIPDDIQERIDAAKAAQAGTTPPPVTTPTTPSLPPVGTTIPLPFGGGLTVTQEMQDRINAAKAAVEAATTTTPRANIATTTSPMVGGRRGLMSREAIENLRKRVDEMRTPPPTPMNIGKIGQGQFNALTGLGTMMDPETIASRSPQGIVAGGPRPDSRGGLLSQILDDSVPVVSLPSEDSLQRSIDNLRDILGGASEGGDGSSGSGDMFSKLRDRLRPTDTKMPTRLPPNLPINLGQQRAPQLPLPRRLPMPPAPNLPDFLQRSQPIDERLEEAKRVIAEMQRGPTPKLPRRRIPINTDKLRRGRR